MVDPWPSSLERPTPPRLERVQAKARLPCQLCSEGRWAAPCLGLASLLGGCILPPRSLLGAPGPSLPGHPIPCPAQTPLPSWSCLGHLAHARASGTQGCLPVGGAGDTACVRGLPVGRWATMEKYMQMQAGRTSAFWRWWCWGRVGFTKERM